MIQSSLYHTGVPLSETGRRLIVPKPTQETDPSVSAYVGSTLAGDTGLIPNPLQMANIRWQIREQENASDVGHAWLEVDDPDHPGQIYSAGAMPGPGLVSPDPGEDRAHSNFGREKFHLVKEYQTTPQEDRRMIKFLESQVEHSKENPHEYWSTHSRGLEIDTLETNACTTTSGRLLRKTFDPSAPVDILQPNDLYNHFHPDHPLPQGPLPISEWKPTSSVPPGPVPAGKGAQK